MALEGGEGSASCCSRFLPLGKTRYPLYRRLGGPQGRSGKVRKILPPPGFDPWTVQPVANRYTDYATRPTWRQQVFSNCHHLSTEDGSNIAKNCHDGLKSYLGGGRAKVAQDLHIEVVSMMPVCVKISYM
jgi:hypothetical protein